MQRILLATALGLISAVLYGQTNLTVSPSTFQLSANAGSTARVTDTATITNTGPAVAYSITSSATWLSATPAQGNLATNGSAQITVSANPSGLEAGNYTGTLTISAAGRQSKTISVTFSIQGVQLTVDPSTWTLSVGQNGTATKTVSFGQVGGSGSGVTIKSSQSWLKISQTSGNTPAVVTVTVNTTGLTPGTYMGTVTATSDAAPAIPKSMTVTLTVTAAQPDLQVSPGAGNWDATNTLNLNGSAGSNSTDSGTANIKNVGPAVTVSATSNQPWLVLAFPNAPAPSTSVQQPFVADSQQLLTITARSANLEAGTYTGSITISAPGRPNRTIAVKFSVNGIAIAIDPPAITLNVAPNSTATATFRVNPIAPVTTASFNVSNPSVPWLTVSPSATPGDRPSGQPVTITVNSATLSAGNTYQTSLTISAQASGPSLPKTLPITVVVGPPGSLLANPNSVTISSTSAFGSVSVQSTSSPITFNAASNRSWLTVVPQHATTPATLTLLVDSTQYDPTQRATVTITPETAGVAPVTIPVTVTAAGSQTLHRYSIPQIADGGAYQTSIILVNTGTSPITASVNMYRSDPSSHATLTWSPGTVGEAATQNVSIAPKTSYTIQTAGLDPVNTVSGWAEVTASGPISGFAVFRQRIGNTDQEAAVPINVDGTNRFFLPYDNQSGFTTSLALVNMSTTDAANVNVTFRSSNGQARTASLGVIPPLGHWPFNLVGQFSYLSGDRGVAEFSASAGLLSSLGLRFNSSQAFTSFEAQYPASTGAQRYSIPQVADGGAYQTSIIVVNDGDSPATVSLRFYKSDPNTHATQPWQLLLAGNASTENINIGPGSSYTVQTAGSDPNNTSVGWAEVVTTAPVSGFAIFRQRIGSSDQEAAVPINAGGQQQLLLPYDNQQGFTTSLALVNLSATDAAPVTITFRSANGQVRTENLAPIPPQGHWAFNLPSMFGYLQGDRGVAEFSTSAGQLSMLGLRFNSSQSFTSFRALTPTQ